MLDEYKAIAIIAAIIVILLIMVFTSKTRIIKTYEKYLNVNNKAGLTGKQFAVISKQKLNLDQLNFAITRDKLGDAYNPKYRTLIISEDVGDRASLSSLTIVAHELGHALQHKQRNFIFMLSQGIAKLMRLTNRLIVPLLIFGLIAFVSKWPNDYAGTICLIAAGVLFAMQALHKFLNVPIEYGASRIALRYLRENNFITAGEMRKAKKLLNTAALTYIASLFDDLFVFGKRKRNVS